MKNVIDLKNNLLLTEFDEAKRLYFDAQAANFAPMMIAAICYKAGFQAGKASAKSLKKQVYKELAEAKEKAEMFDVLDAFLSRFATHYSDSEDDVDESETFDEEEESTPDDEQEDVIDE